MKICIVAILIAGLEKMESGTDEVNIGGKLIDPKMVIASRSRNVAPTIRGNLTGMMGGGISLEDAVLDCVGMLIASFGVVDRPKSCTNRTSFQTPRGTFTRQVERKVIELTSTWSA